MKQSIDTKKFTRKFFAKGVANVVNDYCIDDIAKKSEKELNLPLDSYFDLRYVFSLSKLCDDFYVKENNTINIFMAGFLCGWAEGNNKIK